MEPCEPMGTNARGVAQCSNGHGDYPDACKSALGVCLRCGHHVKSHWPTVPYECWDSVNDNCTCRAFTRDASP